MQTCHLPLADIASLYFWQENRFSVPCAIVSCHVLTHAKALSIDVHWSPLQAASRNEVHNFLNTISLLLAFKCVLHYHKVF